MHVACAAPRKNKNSTHHTSHKNDLTKQQAFRNVVVSNLTMVYRGGIAQLVERPLCMRKVWGSIPHTSILLSLAKDLFCSLALYYLPHIRTQMGDHTIGRILYISKVSFLHHVSKRNSRYPERRHYTGLGRCLANGNSGDEPERQWNGDFSVQL